MKKIMFDDRYGLTKAVIEGRKTMTRRIVSNQEEYYELRWWQPYCTREKTLYGYDDLRGGIWEVIWPTYVIHEEVNLAQSYRTIAYEHPNVNTYLRQLSNAYGCQLEDISNMAAWTNKMFVRSELMPHRIRITGVRAERLQDISDGDCLREGVQYIEEIEKYYFDRKDREEGFYFDSPREAFASLIDKVSGKGTWDSNPWVFVYGFELVK